MDFGLYSGDTSKTVYVRLRDSTTGLGKTGLVFNSSGVSCYYTLPAAAAVQIPLVTTTVAASWTSGGFVLVHDTNAKGLYRLDLPNAAIASGSFTLISIEFDGIIEESMVIPLHTPTVNVIEWLGTAVSTPTVAGVPDVNAKTWNDLVTVALPLIPATPGRTLTIESDGMAHADVKEIIGTAASLTGGDLDVNVTTFIGTAASIGAGGVLSVDADFLAGTVPNNFDPASDAVATVTALTNHTAQTGDTYALANGATGFTAIDTVVDAIKTITDALPDSGVLTSIAQADTMEGFFQITLRSDAAITTDRSAILTLINASEGSGAGDYAATTESQEALRDQGDSAWVTAPNDLDATGVENAVWNATQASHVSVGEFGVIASEIAAITPVGPTKVEMDTAHGSLATEAKQDIIDTEVDKVVVATITNAAGTDISADIADVPTVSEFEARTPTAAQLAYIVENAATGVPVTFSNTATTTTNARLVNVDGVGASSTNDQYNGRLIVFTSGNNTGVVTDITDYDGTNKDATITAIPVAPAAGDNARLI